jgi:hypothetical protein
VNARQVHYCCGLQNDEETTMSLIRLASICGAFALIILAGCDRRDTATTPGGTSAMPPASAASR